MSSAEPRSKPASGDGNPDIQPTGARLKTLLFWGFTLGPQPRQAPRLLSLLLGSICFSPGSDGARHHHRVQPHFA
ncbi:MAG: hypothetical protein RLZZ253_1707 [Verrucomicrobiota bacterium]|jgi:hypothetical protein